MITLNNNTINMSICHDDKSRSVRVGGMLVNVNYQQNKVSTFIQCKYKQ